MEMLKHWTSLIDEKVYANPMFLLAVKEKQVTEFIFNEGITYGRECQEQKIDKLNDYIEELEQRVLQVNSKLSARK